MARPRKYNADDLKAKLDAYIDSTDDCLIDEFLLNEYIPAKTLYQYAKESEELSNSIKRCHHKQALRVQRGAQDGTINATFAIFKLKQPCYGWTDKQEVQNTNVNISGGELNEEEARKYLKENGIKF